MKLDEVVKPAQDALGGRFFLLGSLPTSAAAAFLLVLIWAGAPGKLRFASAWKTAAALGTGEVVLLILAITLVGVASQPLQLGLVRLLEGYWPAWAGWLAAPLRRRHRRRRKDLTGAAHLPERPQDLSQDDLNRLGRAGTELRRRYPVGTDVLPTALGNDLAAAEARAGAVFGWDSVVAWPRLYPVLGEQTRAVVSSRRDLLDTATRLAAVSAVATVASAALLAGSGWWLCLATVPLALSWFAYRSAVEAAAAFGEAVETAFDLHRFDLLTALHLPLPAGPDAERKLAAGLCRTWRQGAEPPGAYEHPAQKPA
jgi:hypothetical protein